LLVEQNDKADLNLAKRAFVLETGKFVLQGPATDLLDDPKVKETYLGGSITAENNDLKISEIPNIV
jgi:branched-chain amino acid transport system ATP-binding protein